MTPTLVDRVLSERARKSVRRQATVALGIAFLLHALAATAVFVLPRVAAQQQEPLDFVAVQILPAPALGRRDAPPPAPTPVEPAAEPEPVEETPTPEETAPEPDVPVLPAEEPERRPEPEPEPAPRPTRPEPDPERRTPPRPESRPAPEGAPEETRPSEAPPGPVGSPEGAYDGQGRFGVQALGVDGTTFPFTYYLDQMLGQIERSWVRPPVDDLEALVSFRVLRDGRIVDVELTRSSGSRAFDLAALRALRNASPLPRLPAAYRQESLMVNLIVR